MRSTTPRERGVLAYVCIERQRAAFDASPTHQHAPRRFYGRGRLARRMTRHFLIERARVANVVSHLALSVCEKYRFFLLLLLLFLVFFLFVFSPYSCIHSPCGEAHATTLSASLVLPIRIFLFPFLASDSLGDTHTHTHTGFRCSVKRHDRREETRGNGVIQF